MTERGRAPEHIAAAVNGLIVLLGPFVVPLVAGLFDKGYSDTSTTVTAGSLTPADFIAAFLPMAAVLMPFAMLAAWRTHVYAKRRRDSGDSGWRGVAEAGVLGFGVATAVLLPGILTRPGEAPPYVIVYGGAALVLGLLVGFLLRVTALIALRMSAKPLYH